MMNVVLCSNSELVDVLCSEGFEKQEDLLA